MVLSFTRLINHSSGFFAQHQSNKKTIRDLTALECDPLKWKNGLSDLLADDRGQQAFAKFLKSEYSGENLSFWLHTRRYRRAPSKYA